MLKSNYVERQGWESRQWGAKRRREEGEESGGERRDRLLGSGYSVCMLAPLGLKQMIGAP